MEIRRYLDVVTLTSHHFSGGCKWWWKIKGGTEDDVLYACFSMAKPSLELRRQAMTAASTTKSKAVDVSESGVITETIWVDPFGPPFKAP